MTPVYNYTHQQTPVPPPLKEIADTEKTILPVKRKEEVSFFASGVLKEVNDPTHWDEAWFANYE
jgi:hypothetical protein